MGAVSRFGLYIFGTFIAIVLVYIVVAYSYCDCQTFNRCFCDKSKCDCVPCRTGLIEKGENK